MTIVLALGALGVVGLLLLRERHEGGAEEAPRDGSGDPSLDGPSGSSRPAAPASPPPDGDGGAGDPPAPPSTRAPVLRLLAAEARVDPTAPHGALRGRVLSLADGAPVAGAELTFSGEGRALTARADARGAFALLPPEVGRFTLSIVEADGFLPYAPEWGHSPIVFDSRAGRSVEGVTILLVPSTETIARVLDAGGERVPGASVRVLGAHHGHMALVPLEERYTTGADGEVAVRAPPDAVVEARHVAHGVGRGRVDLGVRSGGPLVIRLRPREVDVLAISGRVTADRRPVDGALVRATARPELPGARGAWPSASGEAVSDVDGAFELGGLDPGRYELRVSAEGHAVRLVPEVPAGTTGLAVALEPEGALRLSVRDRTGSPVPAFTVLVSVARGAVERRTLALRAVFDAAGEHTLGGLPAGDYLVMVSAHGLARSPELAARVEPGQATELAVTLSGGARVWGIVTSGEGGPPLTGASVSIEDRLGAGDDAASAVAVTTTDGAGRFELFGVPAGLQSIAVEAIGHHARIVPGLRAVDGAALGPLRVALTPAEAGAGGGVELAGIGAVLSAREDRLLVGQVVDGGGAAEVGLGPGDAILTVAGRPVAELGFGGAVQHIRGPVGTSVRLGVEKTDGARVELAVPRRSVRMQ